MKKTFTYLLMAIMITSSVMSVKLATAAKVAVPFTVIAGDTPSKLDPADAYDSTSIDSIAQIFEGLYKYDLTPGAGMVSVPNLASEMGVWSADMKNLTIKLRTDVTFHDGTPFNATAVKWNFDRLNNFVIAEENTPAVLYFNNVILSNVTVNATAHEYDVTYQTVLNKTVIDNNYQITFVLNKPWSVWEKLLAFSGSFIMKPNDAYVDTFITPADLTPCIGTGPFKITEVIPDEKTSFVNFEDYRLGAANITNMVYLAIADGEVASQAMLNHEAHYGGVLPEYLPQAEADPDITIERTKTAVVFYIQMNVNNIPRDARYAMAHAFNYSYYITAITADTSYQIHTPIPDGFAHHNASIVGLPYYNVTLARKILTDSTDATVIAALSAAGITAASTDAQWLAAAESATPVFSYNFTHYTSTTLGRIGTMLIDNMKSIGIKVTDYVVGDWGVWTEWVTVPANKAKMTLSYGGWGPDYNDPINMMEPIYKTGADYNDAMVADSTLDALMASYYEANMTEQADICNQLQHMIAVDICPSFYVQQRGTNIMYNNEYVSHITDNLNVFNNWYWYNFVYVVQFKNTIPGYSFTPMIISFAVVAGFLLMKKRK